MSQFNAGFRPLTQSLLQPQRLTAPPPSDYGAQMLNAATRLAQTQTQAQAQEAAALRPGYELSDSFNQRLGRARQSATSRRGPSGVSPLQASIAGALNQTDADGNPIETKQEHQQKQWQHQEAGYNPQQHNFGEPAKQEGGNGNMPLKGNVVIPPGQTPQAPVDPVVDMFNKAKPHINEQQQAEFMAMAQGGAKPQELATKLDEWTKPAHETKENPRTGLKDFEEWKEKRYPTNPKTDDEKWQMGMLKITGKMPSDDQMYQQYQQDIQKYGGGTGEQSAEPANMLKDMSSKASLPKPPQAGTKLDFKTHEDELNKFLQAAGGDRNKARELAKQAGWSL